MAKRYLIVIWVTGSCNLACKYCYATEANCKDYMNFATAKQVLDSFCDKPLKIQFAGGEPLLNIKLINEICSYVHENNIDATLQLQTNGTLLTKETIELLKRWKISIGVSLDGVPEINDKTREEGQRVIQGIKLLSMEGIQIGINTVVTKHNVSRLGELVDLAIYLGNVGGIGLDLLRQVGSGLDNYSELQVDAAQLKNGFRALIERSQQVYELTGRRIQIREVEKARKRLQMKNTTEDYCYASCGRSLVVLPSGKIYPCGSLIHESYGMGDASDMDSYKEVCLKPDESNKCKECTYSRCCPKGCPSRRIRNSGEDLDCVLLKEAFDIVIAKLDSK